jgi:hypothetical protein
MIAQDSRGTPERARVVSAALAERLRLAIGERWKARSGEESDRAQEALAAALVTACIHAYFSAS